MHGFRCHIVFGALLLALLLSSCGKDEPKHLSQRRFGELYADMLLADEWIALHPQTRRTTDTLLVYASIFEHYGVTVEDVHANLEYYLEDPLRYSRALEVTIKRLERHSREIKTRSTCATACAISSTISKTGPGWTASGTLRWKMALCVRIP